MINIFTLLANLKSTDGAYLFIDTYNINNILGWWMVFQFPVWMYFTANRFLISEYLLNSCPVYTSTSAKPLHEAV